MQLKKKSESAKSYVLIVTSIALIIVGWKLARKQGKYFVTYLFAGGHRDGEQISGYYDTVPDVIIGNSGVNLPAGSYIIDGFSMVDGQILALYSPIEMGLATLEEEENGEETEEDSP